MTTKIEWAEATWNPVTGCTHVSEGCRNCYAERTWARLSKMPNTVYFGRKFTDVQCHEERLQQPLKRRKPTRYFVNSMSDLFHPDVPDSFIDKVFAVMALAQQHTFIVLTKRPERMREYLDLSTDNRGHAIEDAALKISGGDYETVELPLPNVWLGVSVEDQATADERIPVLLNTPAAKRVVSYEPALGPVDFKQWIAKDPYYMTFCGDCGWIGSSETCLDSFYDDDVICPHCNRNIPGDDFPSLDWLIMGGESGSKARPMHPDWARFVRDQCATTGVPFFFKQWGEWEENKKGHSIAGNPTPENKNMFDTITFQNDGVLMNRVGKAKAGRLLDGKIHDEYPGGVKNDAN